MKQIIENGKKGHSMKTNNCLVIKRQIAIRYFINQQIVFMISVLVGLNLFAII